MLAKMLYDLHYKDLPELTMAIADALAEQVRHLDADVVQVDEANLPGSPDEWEWAAARDEPRARRREDRCRPCICASATTAGSRSRRAAGTQLIGYLNALHVDHIVMETAHRPAEELAVFRDLRPEIGFGLGVVDIKSTEIETADQIARAIERAETRCSAPIASNTSIRTAASGCSSATSRTARSARWCRGVISITDARAEGQSVLRQ